MAWKILFSQAAAEHDRGAGPGAHGQGHVLGQGHLEAIMAKQVLLGWKVLIMPCEGINIPGNFYRN